MKRNLMNKKTISEIIYKSDINRYYINENLLFKNPNQAIKFLKEKNLDPTTNPKGKDILDTINGITRGDGYTHLLTKFLVSGRQPIESLRKLHDYLKTNKTYLTKLKKPVVTYDTYNELFSDIEDLEGYRILNRLYNELPANLKQQYQKNLSGLDKERLKATAVKFNKLSPEQQDTFIKNVSGYSNINVFIEQLNNYVTSIENKADYHSVKSTIEQTDNAQIIYDNPNTNVIVAHIMSFDASKKLGCTSEWCITRNESRWREYRMGGNYYFFIWNFNFPSNNINSFAGVAYNPSDPDRSKTHLKDNEQTKIRTVLNQSDFSYEIFDEYIKKYKESKRLAAGTQTEINLASALNKVNDDFEPLLNIISTSEKYSEVADDKTPHYDDNLVFLNISKNEICEMLNINPDELDNASLFINSYSNIDVYEEENYMASYLDNENIEKIVEISKMLGSNISKEDFKEEGVISKFLTDNDMRVVVETYLNELEMAVDDAQKKVAKDIIDAMPINFYNGTIDPQEFFDYMVNNNLTDKSFDEVLDNITSNFPYDVSEVINEARYHTIDYDDLNSAVSDDLDRILQDDDEKFTQYRYMNNELKKMGFTFPVLNGIAKLKTKNMEIIVTDFDMKYDKNDKEIPYVTATIKKNSTSDRVLGGNPTKTISVPIQSLKNYIDQLEINYTNESKVNKIILDELNKYYRNT